MQKRVLLNLGRAWERGWYCCGLLWASKFYSYLFFFLGEIFSGNSKNFLGAMVRYLFLPCIFLPKYSCSYPKYSYSYIGDSGSICPRPSVQIEPGCPVIATLNIHIPTLNIHIPTLNIHIPTLNIHIPTLNIHIPTLNIHIPTLNIPIPILNIHIPTTFKTSIQYSPFHPDAIDMILLYSNPSSFAEISRMTYFFTYK